MNSVRRRSRGYLEGSFAVLATLTAFSLPLAAQAGPPETLLQVEVRDSIGLPLPDATIETFALLERGIVYEWVPVEPSQLPAGIFLLRFSHPGYRPAVFSVPLREDSKVSLRVSLDPLRDTTPPVEPLVARQVRAIGLALEGRAKTDVIGSRRILIPGDLGEPGVTTLGTLMRRATNTDLNVVPARGGTFAVYARGAGGSYSCSPAVIIDGDRRRVMPFVTIDRLYRPEDVEVLEIFVHSVSVPFPYDVTRGGCGVMVMWLKDP